MKGLKVPLKWCFPFSTTDPKRNFWHLTSNPNLTANYYCVSQTTQLNECAILFFFCYWKTFFVTFPQEKYHNLQTCKTSFYKIASFCVESHEKIWMCKSSSKSWFIKDHRLIEPSFVEIYLKRNRRLLDL